MVLHVLTHLLQNISQPTHLQTMLLCFRNVDVFCQWFQRAIGFHSFLNENQLADLKLACVSCCVVHCQSHFISSLFEPKGAVV